MAAAPKSTASDTGSDEEFVDVPQSHVESPGAAHDERAQARLKRDQEASHISPSAIGASSQRRDEHAHSRTALQSPAYTPTQATVHDTPQEAYGPKLNGYVRDMAGLRGQMQSSPSTHASDYGRSISSMHRYSASTSAVQSSRRGNLLLSAATRRRPSWGSSDLTHSSPLHASQGQPETAPGSDSSESRVAASTVWDELDELKSRIQTLEGGGRAPSTSSAAMANYVAGRPQTAITNPTTISSSRSYQERQSKCSPLESPSSEPLPELHPVLQSALLKARMSFNPQIFGPLEACASDALTLASMTRTFNGADTPATSEGPASEPLRQRIDTLCNNLAALCAAMDKSQATYLQTNQMPLYSRAAESARGYDTANTTVPRQAQSRAPFHDRPTSRMSVSRFGDYRSGSVNVTETQSSPLTGVNHNRSPSVMGKDYLQRYDRKTSPDVRWQKSPTTHKDASPVYDRAASVAMTDADAVGSPYIRAKLGQSKHTSQRSVSLRETLEARRRSAHIQTRPEMYSQHREGESYSPGPLYPHVPETESQTRALSRASKRLSGYEMYRLEHVDKYDRNSGVGRRIFSAE